MRWWLVKGLLRLVIGLVVIATLAGGYLFWRAMPAASGSEKLPGLSADARVWRDAYGVPHIFAASMDDAARALGYLHASERLFQMEAQRRGGQGRLAEFWAPIGLQATSSYAPSGSIVRQRAASRPCRPRRKNGCRPTPMASTPSSTAIRMRCRRSSC